MELIVGTVKVSFGGVGGDFFKLVLDYVGWFEDGMRRRVRSRNITRLYACPCVASAYQHTRHEQREAE